MLIYLIEAVIIILIVIPIFRFIKRYQIIRVNGVSMLPTYEPNKLLLMDKLFLREKHRLIMNEPLELINRIFVVNTPDGIYAIKRLTYVADNMDGLFLWFEGDNADNSRDSRDYGFLKLEDIVGEVVPGKVVFRNLFTLKP